MASSIGSIRRRRRNWWLIAGASPLSFERRGCFCRCPCTNPYDTGLSDGSISRTKMLQIAPLASPPSSTDL
jgi:hypothetical protein